MSSVPLLLTRNSVGMKHFWSETHSETAVGLIPSPRYRRTAPYRTRTVSQSNNLKIMYRTYKAT